MALRVGMGPPHNLLVTVNGAGSGLDLSVVTYARFRVWQGATDTPVVFEDGIWPPIVHTSTLMQLRYVFSASGLDLPVAGVYSLRVELTVPEGTHWCVPRKFSVQPGS